MSSLVSVHRRHLRVHGVGEHPLVSKGLKRVMVANENSAKIRKPNYQVFREHLVPEKEPQGSIIFKERTKIRTRIGDTYLQSQLLRGLKWKLKV